MRCQAFKKRNLETLNEVEDHFWWLLSVVKRFQNKVKENFIDLLLNHFLLSIMNFKEFEAQSETGYSLHLCDLGRIMSLRSFQSLLKDLVKTYTCCVLVITLWTKECNFEKESFAGLIPKQFHSFNLNSSLWLLITTSVIWNSSGMEKKKLVLPCPNNNI